MCRYQTNRESRHFLLAVGRFDPATVVSERQHLHRHTHFDTWSYESNRPFSLEALREMVRRELPASVYRCKGIIYASDASERRLALQAVGRRTEIAELGEWGKRTPHSQIVAIGASIDRQELKQKFDACLLRETVD